VPGQRVNGIAVTNRQNIATANFNTMVTNVTNALNHANLSGDIKQNCIKNNIKEIKIIPGSGVTFPSISGGVLTVENGCVSADIRTAILDWLYDVHGITMMDTKDTIRFADASNGGAEWPTEPKVATTFS
jgi:hypothetical protein